MKLSCTKRFIRLSLAIPLLGLGLAHGAAANDVGIVAEYRPAASRFSIERGSDEVVPVRIGTVVAAGDRLSLPSGAAVVIQDGDGQRREFAGPGSFQVPAAKPLGRLASIYRSISAVFDDQYRLAGTAASRSGEFFCAAAGGIQVPILGSQPAILAGTRDLPLTWTGGCAPFTVSVLAGDGATLAQVTVDGRRVRIDQVVLPPGTYEVVVRDANGLEFRTTLEASTVLPELPAEIAADQSPLGIVAGAIWLAEQDGGRWRFDSFERLQPLIAAGDPLAGAIGEGVLSGEPGR